MSPEVTMQIQIWRQRAREGTLTQDEMREAIKLMRADRVSAAETSAKSKAKKAPTAVVSGDDLLKQLEFGL